MNSELDSKLQKLDFYLKVTAETVKRVCEYTSDEDKKSLSFMFDTLQDEIEDINKSVKLLVEEVESKEYTINKLKGVVSKMNSKLEKLEEEIYQRDIDVKLTESKIKELR